MAAVVPNPINESTVGKENDVLGHPHVRNKNNIPRICEMQIGEEHTKEKIHTTQNLRGSPLGLRPQSCSDLSL
jgi:hypothetical protein